MDFVFYRDDAGEIRWRMFSRNGKIVAEGGEGYKQRGKAFAITRKIFRGGAYELQLELAIEKAKRERV